MTAPNLTPAQVLELLRDMETMRPEQLWVKWPPSIGNVFPLARAALETLLAEHEATKAKLATYEAKMPSAFDMVNDAYPFAIAIRDERVGRTLSTPASGVPSLRSAMKDAFRVITGEPLVVEAKEPAAAVPSDEEIAGHIKALRSTGGFATRGEVAAGLSMLAKRIGVKL